MRPAFCRGHCHDVRRRMVRPVLLCDIMTTREGAELRLLYSFSVIFAHSQCKSLHCWNGIVSSYTKAKICIAKIIMVLFSAICYLMLGGIKGKSFKFNELGLVPPAYFNFVRCDDQFSEKVLFQKPGFYHFLKLTISLSYPVHLCVQPL